MQCLRRPNVRAPVPYSRWQRVVRRRYADDGGEPAWLEKLRDEMLNRKLPESQEHISKQENVMLHSALQQHLPHSYFEPNPAVNKPGGTGFALPLGWHQIHFFTIPRRDQTLPDGSDTLHNPGPPFTRRMWAGGALHVDIRQYYSPDRGLRTGDLVVCGERISDVQLRGKKDEEKLFVTIERRFDNRGVFGKNWMRELRTSMKPLGLNRDAALLEKRTLVFMREESEKDKLTRLVTPVRYLPSPGNPDFSTSLTPDPALLFRFSALTFNAHAIHIDPHYAREVEGHKNLLVHGPLSLTLMLAHMEKWLRTEKGPPKAIQSIEYRNMAPLYCGEQMRLCLRRKSGEEVGESVYDIWVEGPTGGMAVKGTVKTITIPPETMQFLTASNKTASKMATPAPNGTQEKDGSNPTSVKSHDSNFSQKNGRAQNSVRRRFPGSRHIQITQEREGSVVRRIETAPSPATERFEARLSGRQARIAQRRSRTIVHRVKATPDSIPERFMSTPAGHHVRERRMQQHTRVLFKSKFTRSAIAAQNRNLLQSGSGKRVQVKRIVRTYNTTKNHSALDPNVSRFAARGARRVVDYSPPKVALVATNLATSRERRLRYLTKIAGLSASPNLEDMLSFEAPMEEMKSQTQKPQETPDSLWKNMAPKEERAEAGGEKGTSSGGEIASRDARKGTHTGGGKSSAPRPGKKAVGERVY